LREPGAAARRNRTWRTASNSGWTCCPRASRAKTRCGCFRRR